MISWIFSDVLKYCDVTWMIAVGMLFDHYLSCFSNMLCPVLFENVGLILLKCQIPTVCFLWETCGCEVSQNNYARAVAVSLDLDTT